MRVGGYPWIRTNEVRTWDVTLRQLIDSLFFLSSLNTFILFSKITTI